MNPITAFLLHLVAHVITCILSITIAIIMTVRTGSLSELVYWCIVGGICCAITRPDREKMRVFFALLRDRG